MYCISIDLAATGARIRFLRQMRNIKVSEISEFMGFDAPQAVYKWQRGETLPSVDNLYALSKLFGVTMEDILVTSGENVEASASIFDQKEPQVPLSA